MTHETGAHPAEEVRPRCLWRDRHPRHVCDVRRFVCSLCAWESALYCYKDAARAMADTDSHYAAHSDGQGVAE